MTQDETRRVHEAIADCDRQIAREMAYSPKFRNEPSIKFHEQHKAKMQAMLAALKKD